MLSPKRGDVARIAANHAKQLRHERTARPKRAHVKTLGWLTYGALDADTLFIPQLVTIDPADDDYPEYKQVVGVDGWLGAGGPAEVTWQYNTGLFLTGHVITAGQQGASNRVMLDGLSGRPDPFIIENGATYGGEFLGPVMYTPGSGSTDMGLYLIIETVPV